MEHYFDSFVRCSSGKTVKVLVRKILKRRRPILVDGRETPYFVDENHKIVMSNGFFGTKEVSTLSLEEFVKKFF